MLGLMVIMFYTTASVASRGVLGYEFFGTVNIAEFSLVVITFLGLSWTQINQGHVSAQFFILHFPRRAQVITQVWIAVASLFFAVVLTSATWSSAVQGYTGHEIMIVGSEMVPVWPIRFVLPVGAALYVFTLLFNLRDSLSELIKDIGR